MPPKLIIYDHPLMDGLVIPSGNLRLGAIHCLRLAECHSLIPRPRTGWDDW
jgi:hypothetical protein